jgi:hypothetical protein
LILLLGPVPIVVCSIALTRWARSEPAPPLADNHAVVRGQSPDERPSVKKKSSRTATPIPIVSDLADDCQQVSLHLAKMLGEGCHVVVHEPFIIAGDMSRDDLDLWYKQTIGPAARAMAHAYFRVPPSRPITVLLFASEKSYNHFAKTLYGEEGVSIYGYYKPNQRTLVMNISTGGGTLVHELTHALMDFDFPKVPDWFNEGLASLHEQCHIRANETGIDGLVNWRLAGLQEAVRRGKVTSLEDLIHGNDFRGPQVGLNYALARYFCLYMQRHEVLEDFFHRFHAAQAEDPTGAETVRKVFSNRSWAELDEDFQRWVLTLK